MSKHQAHIPALLIAFFHISSNDSHTVDEQLKVDINAIRTALTRSGYKTRFSAILLSDKSILQAPDLEERLSSIRRLTSLDSKTGLFFMPPMNSAAEIATFVHSVMTSTLQPLVVEYYRDLTKHARRKKTKGGPAPSISSPIASTAGATALSSVGWNARYEIKLGVFAEFRQEMDVAERHFSSALDELFSSEGVFETTPSWSPRWEEARLLADSLALRQLRCLLWNERTTGAVQCWLNFRKKMRDLVDRRGKGSETYGWSAWEARWAQMMAELVQRADILAPPSKGDQEVQDSPLMGVFATPEKSASTTMERLPPWQNMHHPGYWYRLAVRGSRERHRRAQEIPEDDRKPPTSERKGSVYDTYLAGQPNEECEGQGQRSRSQAGTLTERAVAEYHARGQSRMSDVMKIELARDLFEASLHSDALAILVPLWGDSRWRGDDWYDLFTDLLILLRDCANKEERIDIVVATTYELVSVPSIRLEESKSAGLNLMEIMDSQTSTNELASMTFQGKERLSPVALSVAFESKETNVGEAIGCQLIVRSKLNGNAASIPLSSIDLQIGKIKRLHIKHDPTAESKQGETIDLSNLSEGANGTLEATANLDIQPGERRIYNFPLTFREANEFAVQSASISIATDNFTIKHSFIDEDLVHSDSIFVKKNDVLERRLLPHAETATIKVLPKPPKVRILLHGLRKQYYTDELVRLGVEVVNGESDSVSGKITARSETFVPLQWIESGSSTIDESNLTSESIAESMDDLEPSGVQKTILAFKAPQDPTNANLVLDVNYTLSGDDTTPLRKSLNLDLHFAIPFEVKFSFGPLLYKELWPSYFDHKLGYTAESPGGIPQRWRLSTQIHSLASDNIRLKNIAPVINEIVSESTAKIVNPEIPDTEPFAPGVIERASFEILTQKFSLEDRRPTTVESTLEITWARDEHCPVVTTKIPVPRLTLPVSEPRVLCTLDENITSESDENGLWDVALHYYIENPSTHFLTFALTMEATEEFAFSGPKYRTLSLAPLSRHKVEYRLALQDPIEESVVNDRNEKGRWIWPSLQVIDSYYQKTLRVHPGGDHVKFDDKSEIAVFIKDK